MSACVSGCEVEEGEKGKGRNYITPVNISIKLTGKGGMKQTLTASKAIRRWTHPCGTYHVGIHPPFRE